MDENIKQYFQDGKEAINEMGEGFLPYLQVLIKNNVKDAEIVCSIFGSYLYTRKVGSDGSKNISKFSFQNYVIKLLYGKDIKKIVAEEE